MTKPAPKLPDRETLAQLDTAQRMLEADRDAIAKRQKDLDAKYIGTHGVHGDAFSITRKLLHMAPVQRNEFLRHLLHYVEVLGLDKQGDLYEVPLDAKVTELRKRAG